MIKEFKDKSLTKKILSNSLKHIEKELKGKDHYIAENLVKHF